MSRALVQLIVDVIDRGSGNLKKVSRELQGVDKAQEGATKTSKGMNLSFGQLAAGAASVTAALYTAKKAFDFAQEGAALNQLEDSFNLMNQEVFKTPDLLDQMTKASRGTITEAKLMAGLLTLTAGTTRELSTAFAEAAPRLLEIAKASNKLNPTLGDTAFLYESIAKGIKRSSPLILDNLGIVVKVEEANRKFADSIGKATDELSAEEKQMALLNAVLESGDRLIQQVGGDVDSATDSYANLTTQVAEFTDQAKRNADVIARELFPAFKGADDEARDLNQAIYDMGEAVKDGTLAWEDYQYIQEIVKTDMAEAIRIAEEFRKRQEQIASATQSDLVLALRAANYRFGEQVDVADDADVALRRYGRAVEETAEIIDLAKTRGDKWQETLDAANPAFQRTERELRRTEDAWKDQSAAIEEAAEEAEKALQAFFKAQIQYGKRWIDALEGDLDFFKTSLDELGPQLVLTGGLTADQARVVEEATDNYNRVGQEIADYRTGLRGYGMDADEVADRINDLAQEQAYWQDIIGRYSGIQATANMAIKESQVDIDKVTDSFISMARAMSIDQETLATLPRHFDDASEAAAFYGGKIVELELATGRINEQQADQILNAIKLQGAIDATAKAYLSGEISATNAAAALQAFSEGQFSTIDAALAAGSAYDSSGKKLGEYSGAANTAITDTDNLTRKLNEADGTSVETTLTTVEKVDKQQAETDLGEFQDKLWQVAHRNKSETPQPYTIQMESNALKVRDEEIQPLQDASNAVVENGPYIAQTDANVEPALARLHQVNVYADWVTRDRTIDVFINTHGDIPGAQHGAMTQPGQAFIVGEAGPELFVAPSAGQIVPNNQIHIGNLNVPVNLSGNTADPFKAGKQLARGMMSEMGDLMRG